MISFVGLRKQVSEWACGFEQVELLGAVAFTSPLQARQARVRAAGWPVELLGQKAPDSLSSRTLLIFTIQHGTVP